MNQNCPVGNMKVGCTFWITMAHKCKKVMVAEIDWIQICFILKLQGMLCHGGLHELEHKN